ncbi:MAG: SH3 domain-containing protein [Jatrophihabitantaceae bacterium]
MRVRHLFSRRFLTSAATLPLLAGGLAVLTPGVAEAATCYQSWLDKDANGWGTGKDSAGGPYTIPLRNGIYADRNQVAAADVSKKLWYHCYRRNSFGNTWTHLRIDGTNWSGWVYDGNLDDNGSAYPC